MHDVCIHIFIVVYAARMWELLNCIPLFPQGNPLISLWHTWELKATEHAYHVIFYSMMLVIIFVHSKVYSIIISMHVCTLIFEKNEAQTKQMKIEGVTKCKV